MFPSFKGSCREFAYYVYLHPLNVARYQEGWGRPSDVLAKILQFYY